jgi:hypothetical protein
VLALDVRNLSKDLLAWISAVQTYEEKEPEKLR